MYLTTQERALLETTLYNLQNCKGTDLQSVIALMTDSELETELNARLKEV